MGARVPRAITLTLVGLILLDHGRAAALPRYGPFEVSGNIAAQELIRFNPDIDKYALVQQRNTFKLRVDYQMFENGQVLQKYDVPFIDRGKVFILYRGVYDSVYGLTPGFSQRDIYGNPISSRLDDLSNRDAIAFENELREAYIDLAFKQIPFSLRLGRQQIVWGETDNFRMLDRVNALDLSWHLQQESWDELRTPYWMMKGLWDFRQLGPLSNSFFEFYWNPGDWVPAKRVFQPRPWSVPFESPIPVLVDNFNKAFQTFAPKKGFTVSSTLYNETQLFRQGDYARNPMDNSQVGARFSAVTPQGVQFTVNYFYGRENGDDGTNTAAFSILNQQDTIAALKAGQLPIEAIAPYVHTFGFSLNYAEDEYTQTVYRMETIYELGVPFSDSTKTYVANKPPITGLTDRTLDRVAAAVLSNNAFGVSKRDMWKGMLAFDRPTWIRAVNRKATVLILGQFFWHYLVDNPNILCAKPSTDKEPCGGQFNPQIKGFRGSFSSSGFTSGGVPFIDKVRDWESLVTLAATTFYKGGKIVPFVVYVLDPVNSYNMEVIWMFDYFITNDIILNLSQRYFINTVDHPVFETWGVAGTNRGRSETGIRLTFQF